MAPVNAMQLNNAPEGDLEIFTRLSSSELATHCSKDVPNWILSFWRKRYEQIPNLLKQTIPKPLSKDIYREFVMPKDHFFGLTIDNTCEKHRLAILRLSDCPNTSKLGQSTIKSLDSIKEEVLQSLKNMRRTDIELRDIEVLSTENIWGESFSLGAAVLLLSDAYALTIPDDLTATGCWDKNRRTFQQVDKDTIGAKCQLAAEWGFTRMLVPKGQEMPARSECKYIDDIQMIKIDNVQELLINMIHMCDIRNEGHALHALKTIDTTPTLRCNEDLVKKSTLLFIGEESENTGLASLAHYVLQRMHLHLGRHSEAEIHSRKCIELFKNQDLCQELADYLAIEPFATMSIMEIDSGKLDDSGGCHQKLDECIEHLNNTLTPNTTSKQFQKNICLNTRATRRCFLGRLDQDLKLLELAWDDATTCILDDVNAWKVLTTKVAEERLDTSIQRRINYLLDIQASIKDIDRDNYVLATKNLDLLKKLDIEFVNDQTPDYVIGKEKDGEILSFDLLSWLKLQYVLNRKPGTILLNKIVDATRESEASEYLKTRIYEYILHRFPSNVNPEELIPHIDRSGCNPGILQILRLRTRSVLGIHGVVFKCVEPDQNTDLYNLYKELESSPDTIFERCPY